MINSIIKLCDLFEQASMLLKIIYENQNDYISIEKQEHSDVELNITNFESIRGVINNVNIYWSYQNTIVAEYIENNIEEYVDFVWFVKQTLQSTIQIPSDTAFFNK